MSIQQTIFSALILLFPLFVAGTAIAQQKQETIVLERDFRGRPIQVSGQLLLPPGSGKVPATVIVHGSGGVTDAREFRYAREMVAMGVAALVIDAFKPRSIGNTVADQDLVSSAEIAQDAFAALKALAAHPRIDPAKIGIFGFSKGGTVSLLTAHDRHLARAKLPAGMKFALHIPFYPACTTQYARRKTTNVPILMLIGGADTYAGVKPCTDYAEKLKKDGAKIEVKIYPDAPHGFDTDTAYNNPKGENWSRCIFDEQPDGSFKELTSGIITDDTSGRRIEAARQKALSICRSYGITGGPNAAARSASMNDLKAAVRRDLLGQN